MQVDSTLADPSGVADATTNNETSNNADNGLASLSPEQVSAALGAIINQNEHLTQTINTITTSQAEKSRQDFKKDLASLPDNERADRLQYVLDALEATANKSKEENLSRSVWQERDAIAAREMLAVAGLKGDESELYRGPWNAEWLPNFSRSFRTLVEKRAEVGRNANHVTTNPANSANVGNNGSSSMPDIDVNTMSGYDILSAALRR